ncbi:carbohydrate ABC transporter permease [Brachybacterium sp. EF45031]|uniref:carbohydrate ABC transporter permease n=1 Tax=Brachybacterium sillae TaxID=2810536 RepID=UPI00217DB350|nr:carbohydrate ABC transporter permease [Brachybacterium sillae]MCS6711970.1 carbohydrate ABC transporter permease [Brachybacterium sillae]
MRISAAERTMNYVLLALFALFAAGPLLTILVTSLSARVGQTGAFHPENFLEAWRIGGFGQSFWHSAVVAVIVVSVALVASVLAGFAFGTMRFRGAGILFPLFLLGLMIPAEAIVIPLFFDLRTVGLTDTYAAIALPQIAQSIAFGTFWMRAQFRAMPMSLLEAAALDGAGALGGLARVAVPSAMPSIITLAVLLLLWTWNEFLIALVMAPSGQLRTAPLGLANFQGQYTSENALLAAGAIIVALPMLLVFLVLQRHVIRGMLDGAIKD